MIRTLEAESEATETWRWSEGSLECLSDLLEGTPVGSGPKGKLRAEIDSTKKGRISCLLLLLKVRQRQQLGDPLAFVEVKSVKFEFSSGVFA